MELEVAEATANVKLNKSESGVATLTEQLRTAEKKPRNAAISYREAAKSKARMARCLHVAKEDERTHYERVLESLSSISNPFDPYKQGSCAMLDVCDLHRAKHVDGQTSTFNLLSGSCWKPFSLKV